MPVQFLGREDPLEEGMATRSRICAWRTPWTEEPGGLQSMGSQRDTTVSDTTDMTEHRCDKQKSLSNSLKSESGSAVSNSLRPHRLCSPWNSPGQNTGVGSISLLQGIFPTQGWNPGLPHCGWILYQLSPQGSPTTSDFQENHFLPFPRHWGRGHVTCHQLLEQGTTHLVVNLHFLSWCLAGEKPKRGLTGLKSGCLQGWAPRLTPPSTPRPAAASGAWLTGSLSDSGPLAATQAHRVVWHSLPSQGQPVSNLILSACSGDGRRHWWGPLLCLPQKDTLSIFPKKKNESFLMSTHLKGHVRVQIYVKSLCILSTG